MSDPREWIAASKLPGIGPATLARLRQEGLCITRLLRAEITLPPTIRLRRDTLEAIHQFQYQGPLFTEADQLWQQAGTLGIQVLGLDHADYPELLAAIPDPPLALWLKGEVTALNVPQLGVVGSRHASRSGVQLAYDFASALAQSGVIACSGLALGIDAAAHQACVDADCATVAVLGTGVDRIYPRRHQRLSEQILASGGALVSEYPPGTAPLQGHFPRRNRIISGLSVGTLVVEAALRSGSLITARQALEQGREVFAIPGSIHNPLSRGCHALIREGATLVETIAQVVEQLGSILGLMVPEQKPAREATPLPDASLSPELQQLLQHIPWEPLWLDHLVSESGLPLSRLQALLMQLELEGLITLASSRVCRIR
ncbi:DNA-processing protein DprA [Marinobacterium sp. MBR-109]|jgi:DNA processing protein|uniref:DNA-processing protein DprA n=1 Tax=Marinobacterium sp. MBR-109 TaxID=3156462 RepID=UPI0033957FAD